MALLPDIHFEISERKVLLRILDIVFVLVCLQLVGNFFDFDYFKVSQENWVWIIVLMGYLSIFGTVFELYNLHPQMQIQAHGG